MKKVLVLGLFAVLCCGMFSAQANVMEKVAFYLPNRVMDLLDMGTVTVGVGPSVRAELMVTEYCKFGGGIGISGKLLKEVNRQYGFGINNGWYWQLLCTGQEDMQRAKTNRWVNDYDYQMGGVPDYTDVRMYNFYNGSRDFWRIGGALGLGVEAELYLHPVDIADFVTGLFFIDLKGDDFGSEDFQ